MAVPVHVIGVFDAAGRQDLLDRAWDRLRGAPGSGWTGPELGPQDRGFPVLRLGVRAPASSPGAARLRRASGLLAAGTARLYDPVSAGPDPEAEDLDRLAAAWRAGDFDRVSTGPAALEGDYAVVLFDLEASALILLRDAMGHEPLFHARTPEGLVLFSTWAHAIRPDAPDAEALACWYDARALPPGRTVWPGLRAVPAGHALRVDASGARARPHWRPGPDPAAAGLSDAEAVELCLDRARAAVLSRWRRCGRSPGVLFSGGLDSSLIAGLLCEAEPDAEIVGYASASREGGAPSDRSARRAMQARWPNLRVVEITSEGMGLLDHSGMSWDRLAEPNLDYFAATHFNLPQAMLRDRRDALLGGFGGDACVSSQLGSMLFHRLSRLDLPGAWREARSLRRMGFPGRVLAASVVRPARQLVGLPGQRRRPVVRLGPPRPDLPGAPDRETRLTSPLAEMRRALLTRETWMLADFHYGEVAMPYAHPLFDTRLIAAAMAAPLRLQRLDGLSRGFMRRMLLRVAPEEVALRRNKEPFQPDLDLMLDEALPAIRADLRGFRDLPLWRELVDEPLLRCRLEALEAGRRRAGMTAVNGVTSAWFLGDFLRRL